MNSNHNEYDDWYHILEQWNTIKASFDAAKSSIDLFMIKPSRRGAGVKPRKHLKDLYIQCKGLRKDVLRQKQDYLSDYS